MFHIVFIGAFGLVAAIVAGTTICAAFRSRRALSAHRDGEIRWHADFEALPARDRQCRHVLTGEFRYRECPHAFDCRACETHSKLVARRRSYGRAGDEVFGIPYPSDRLYHRGHAWARPEGHGLVTVGLDEIGRRLLGVPDAVHLPPAGTRLHVNGTAWRARKRNAEVRVLSPVEGNVVALGGPKDDWVLRVQCAPDGPDLRHLLTPAEVRPWVMRELERLQLALAAEGEPALADGGVPVGDIAAAYPGADWDAVCGEMFLES
jgi:glycine cleavage system H protein